MDSRALLASTPAVDAAIARVINAEAAARASVRHCQQQAEALVRAAEARARAIAEHAAHRTARVHEASDRLLAARMARVDAERSALATAKPDRVADTAVMAMAIERLADELTGSA